MFKVKIRLITGDTGSFGNAVLCILRLRRSSQLTVDGLRMIKGSAIRR